MQGRSYGPVGSVMETHQAANQMGSKMLILDKKIHSVHLKDLNYWI